MKKKAKYLFTAIVMFILSLSAVACGKEPLIELYIAGNLPTDHVYEVVPGGEVQFETRLENVDEASVEYVVTNGHATISGTGLLTVDREAIVKSTITVVAKSGTTESNSITINVVDLKPESISLLGNREKIAKGGSVEFDVEYTPDYATIKDYTLSIDEGSEIATLENNVLTIKDSADPETIVDETIVVKATLNKDTSISDTFEVKVVDADDISEVLVNNVTYNVGASGNKSLDVEVRNEAGDKLSIDVSDLVFSSSNEAVATIAQATGRIIPHGHGQAEITVSTPNGKIGKCLVSVIVPPQSISLEGVSDQIVAKQVMTYSKADPLKLDVKTNNTQYKCTDKLSYTFELQDPETDATIASGDSVAVVTDDGIEFKTTGKIKVTIKSDSSIGNYRVDSYEKSMSLTINVNDGVNVDSVADLVDYAKAENAGKTCNITKDIFLTETENFGKNDKGQWKELLFYGDRVVYGNGYVISTEYLPLTDTDNTETGCAFLEFVPNGGTVESPAPFVVELYDLEIVGCVDYAGQYNGQLEAHKGQSAVHLDKLYASYRRGLVVKGTEYNKIANVGKNYAKDTIISNVRVSGFEAGIRLSHIVNGLVSNVEVRNCFINGIESDQNIIEFNNITVGQVGAFAIELVPDDMGNRINSLEKPYGTAGADYNKTSEVTMTGWIRSENYNNGASTPYMQLLKAQGIDIPKILAGVVAHKLRELAGADTTFDEAKQLAAMQLVEECLYKDAQTDKRINLYLLIFVNLKEGFQQYPFLGNTEGVFANYSSDQTGGNMINMSEILDGFAAEGANYDDYKNYKYIQMDLYPVAYPVLENVNLGQVVLVNEAYEPQA